MPDLNRFSRQQGVALLIALIVLSVFSLLGLYLTLNATTGLQISDNYEGRIRATCAARSGINHARALVRGLVLNHLLSGPDGTYNSAPSYRAQARSFAFRNPVPLAKAYFLNILDPFAELSQLPDDGIINTGFYAGVGGIALIPITGIVLGEINSQDDKSIQARYFVKVTDNNGEVTEIAGDPDNNPFIDGDGIVIVRSLGIARTISDSAGSNRRSNSVVVLESRLKRLLAFDVGPAVVVEGNKVDAFFDGAYEVAGGMFPAIGVIDTMPGDEWSPGKMIRDAIRVEGNVTGGGLPVPSVQEIGQFSANFDKSNLLDPQYLWDFVHRRAVSASDHFFEGDQNWIDGNMPYAGTYDCSKPANAPGQDPKAIVVNGNLNVKGNFAGAGLLIVTGSLIYQGTFTYDGLIILVGSGRLLAAGSGRGITGGVFLANLAEAEGKIQFGTPQISITGYSRITGNRDAVRMALSLIPPLQISLREIAGEDP